jgi:hypothetical protein
MRFVVIALWIVVAARAGAAAGEVIANWQQLAQNNSP